MLYRLTIKNERDGSRVGSSVVKGWAEVMRCLAGMEKVPYDAPIQPSLTIKAITGRDLARIAGA